MTGRTAVLAALALVAGCGKKNDDKATETKAGSAGSAGPAQEGSAKPQPSEAAPEGTKPPPAGSAGSDGSASASGEAPAALTWDKYVSKENGFSIELPGKAEERDQGGLKIVGAEFGMTKGDQRTSMCGVAFMALPKADNPQQILEASVARHKENAKVIEDKEIKLGKHPGRTLVVQNDSHRKWMRVYLVDKTIYIVNCGGPFDRAATDGPIAEKSLASFALTK